MRGPAGILVVGYGNELRGDDAVGPRVAREVESLGLPNVVVRTAHQLTPELAEALSRVGTAVFVDASVGGIPGTVETTLLGPPDLPLPLGHVSDPRQVLALAGALYGASPSAWWVRIYIADVSWRSALSAPVAAAVPAAVAAVRRLAG